MYIPPNKVRLWLITNFSFKKKPPSRYWNWFLDGGNLTSSPLLDGSPYSFGGDGVFIRPPPNRSALIDLAPVFNNVTWNLTTLEGTGGGCVTTGPFANWTVPFGPVGPNLTDSIRENITNFIKYRPHCLSRSFRPKIAAFSFTKVSLDAILQSPNITEFNKRFTFIINPTVPTLLNLHGKGHQGTSFAIFYLIFFRTFKPPLPSLPLVILFSGNKEK